MVYHAIGVMSGSSMDGLDIAYCIIEEVGGKWSYQIPASTCVQFNDDWTKTLSNIHQLGAKELLISDRAFGRFIGQQINHFIETNHLQHKIHIIGSHGHTVFHEPQHGMTYQMGCGASIAAETKLAVVSNLRDMDVALGGQGAPIVPIGEQLFWNDIQFFLNLGGIANISFMLGDERIAYDVCPANRVLNELANKIGQPYDHNGDLARSGKVDEHLLNVLNSQAYYNLPYPKSLHNEFGSETLMEIIRNSQCSGVDALRTYVEHITHQIAQQVEQYKHPSTHEKMLVTGGGAFNVFLIERLREKLIPYQLEAHVPDAELVNNKEALVMALMAVLRWREEENVLQSVSGANRNSVGGALWMGQN